GLFIARERRLAWRVPYFTLQIADLLIKIGEYDHARMLFADVLAQDTETPILRILRSTLALELSLIFQESNLRTRANTEASELAFRSGEPRHIGPITAATVRIAIASGDMRRAKSLIARGVQALPQADHGGELFALAARYGSLADASLGKQRLVERMALPNHGV